MAKDMDGVGKHFKMGLVMKECGKTMYLMDEEFLYKRMEDDTKDNLKMSLATGKEDTYQETKKQFMKGSSKMICRMVLEHK